MRKIKKIYCGGRFYFDSRYEDYKVVAERDYRSTLLGDVDRMLSGRGEMELNDNIIYLGPYYFETADMDAEDIVRKELAMIDDCTDAIFVLDESNCPGTITELIYAAKQGKHIHIFYKAYSDNVETESALHTPCWFAIIATQQITNVAIIKYDDYGALANKVLTSLFQE